MSSSRAPRRQSRIIPDAWASGTWVYHLRVPWTCWHFVWPTAWLETTPTQPAWKLPVPGRACPSRAVAGGLDLPLYLGSRSTFILGKFGGHSGRTLRAGDVLHLCDSGAAVQEVGQLPESLIPQYQHDWEICALYGPHVAPDFF